VASTPTRSAHTNYNRKESPMTKPQTPGGTVSGAPSALLYTVEELQRMADCDLDAVVATGVFGQPAPPAPLYTTWIGFGLIVEHMQERGYTLNCNAFEASHLDWMNNLPSNIKNGDNYHPAEVSVVDIHHQLPSAARWPNWRVSENTLPRAAAIASVLISQMEKRTAASTPEQPCPHTKEGVWSDERRRQQVSVFRRPPSAVQQELVKCALMDTR
jgi:hypothetical protein